MVSFITKNNEQTFALGKKIGQADIESNIIALSGHLGAGKTIFVKGLAAGLGIKQTVRSPSFNLLKVYAASKKRRLVHVDCYRLKSPAQAIEIGLLEYLGQPKTIVAIEWPERIKTLLKKFCVQKIKFKILSKNRRQLFFLPSARPNFA